MQGFTLGRKRDNLHENLDHPKQHNFKSAVRVLIPIALNRSFECFLFSTLEFKTGNTAAKIAWKTLNAWPRIKSGIISAKQILTHQEMLALRHSAVGLTSQQAAEQCGSTERMMNFHIGSSLRKLDAPNKTAAVLKAVWLGII